MGKDNEDQPPEERFLENIKAELTDVIFKNTVEYAMNKFKQKLPEWRERYQAWKKKFFG